MANRKREGEFESGPPRRPAGPGEPEERTDTGWIPVGKKGWRSRFPGWETYEGRAREARFEHGEDPTHDIRYDTNLNPSMVIPRHLGLVVYVLGAVVGFLLLVFLGLAMFYHFMEPASRSPANPQGQFRVPASQNLVIAGVNHGPAIRFTGHQEL